MGHLWLNGWGIYDLMGGAFTAYMSGAVMASCGFVWKNPQKNAGLQGNKFAGVITIPGGLYICTASVIWSFFILTGRITGGYST